MTGVLSRPLFRSHSARLSCEQRHTQQGRGAVCDLQDSTEVAREGEGMRGQHGCAASRPGSKFGRLEREHQKSSKAQDQPRASVFSNGLVLQVVGQVLNHHVAVACGARQARRQVDSRSLASGHARACPARGAAFPPAAPSAKNIGTAEGTCSHDSRAAGRRARLTVGHALPVDAHDHRGVGLLERAAAWGGARRSGCGV